MEIDEVAARLVRRYWAVVVLCIAVPLGAVGMITLRQPPMYAADVRINPPPPVVTFAALYC